MNAYELTLILDAQLPPEKQEELVAKILDFLKTRNVEILNIEKWGKKKLAYPIADRQYGYYLMTQFRAPAELIVEIEHFLRVTPSIFRHLILHRDPRTLKIMNLETERLAREVSKLAERERLSQAEHDAQKAGGELSPESPNRTVEVLAGRTDVAGKKE